MTQNIGIGHGAAGSALADALRQIKAPLILSGIAIVALIVGGSFIPTQVGQILAGILTALITTLVSVLATYHSSTVAGQRGAKDELTRYGLLAWRNLDSLQLKVNQQLQRGTAVTTDTMREWLLDIDQAKWAWQDVLREVFVLQERLQAETYELAQVYKEKMRQANPEDLPRIQAQHHAQLAKLVSASPLPLRIPVETKCPNCQSTVTVLVGQSTGDTHTTRCPSCRRVFHAHRAEDGSVFTKRHGSTAQSFESALPQTAVKGQAQRRSISPEVRRAGLEAVRDLFAAAPGEVISSWEEFFAKVGSSLERSGIQASEARTVHRWLFAIKAFRLLGPGKGVGLVPTARDIFEFFEERAIPGLITEMPQATPENLAGILYGSHYRVAALQQALGRFRLRSAESTPAA